MAKRNAFHLELDQILDTAIAILREEGLQAVSMRSVSSRLGVSPVPLYTRVGDKEALLDAMMERLLADLAPSIASDESWPEYAKRWALEFRARIQKVPDVRLMLRSRRWAYAEAGKPLVAAMLADGVDPDAAVRNCRLLMWATIGFSVVEAVGTSETSSSSRTRYVVGGDPAGVTADEVGELFANNVRYLIDGLVRDMSDGKGKSASRPTKNRSAKRVP